MNPGFYWMREKHRTDWQLAEVPHHTHYNQPFALLIGAEGPFTMEELKDAEWVEISPPQ